MKLPVTFILIFFFCSAFSQREILFDLDSYKQVVFKRSALIITPDGGFAANDDVNVVGSEFNFDVNFGTEFSHSKIINSQDEQYELDQRFYFKITEGYQLNGQRSNIKRRYSGNRYLKTGADFDLLYNRESTFNGVKNNKGDLQAKGIFGFGFGRVEYINHAWSAVQIMQSLEDNGLLLKMPTVDEITAFANKIGSVRTRRILDFRLRDLAILETMIDYLKENNFIEELSTKAILIIEDTFEYDELATRSSGNRLEFAFDPNARYLFNNTSNPNNPKQIYLGTNMSIIYEKFKNIDVKWYRTETYGSHLDLSKRYRLSSTPDTETTSQNYIAASLRYAYGYRYIPNLRNYFILNIESSIFMDAIKLSSSKVYKFSAARFRFNLTAGYRHYFSPTTSLNINGALGYIDEEFQSGLYQPKISGVINFSISHNVF